MPAQAPPKMSFHSSMCLKRDAFPSRSHLFPSSMSHLRCVDCGPDRKQAPVISSLSTSRNFSITPFMCYSTLTCCASHKESTLASRGVTSDDTRPGRGRAPATTGIDGGKSERLHSCGRDDNLSGCLTTRGIPPHPPRSRPLAKETVFMLHFCSTAQGKLGMQH